VILDTLPETTPVNEAIEAAYALEEQIGVHLGPIVVNGVDEGPLLPSDAAPAHSPLRLAAEFRNARRALHAAERARLAHDLALPQLALSLVPGSALDADAVAHLATEWDRV
jgi:hypothetical protein